MGELYCEWVEDQIFSYIHEQAAKENPIELADLTYRQVFPEDMGATPNSLDSILHRLQEDDPDGDVQEIFEKAKEIFRANYGASNK